MTAPSLDNENCCVLCGRWNKNLLLAVENAPAFPFWSNASDLSPDAFGRLQIVECTNCGHVCNASFNEKICGDMYGSFLLTNTPVSQSMRNEIINLADFILSRTERSSTVLEIGGGGGALALNLAERSGEVHLVEPSLAISSDLFANSRVMLHQSLFPAPSLGDRLFDVVVCRQVLEHVPDPVSFLSALRRHLKTGAIAYIEVPSAEYIENNSSIVDFHYQHVHYYRLQELKCLFAQIGLKFVSSHPVKGGHDVGILVRGDTPKEVPQEQFSNRELGQKLASRLECGKSRLRSLEGPVALYGANAYAQAFLGLYPDQSDFAAMFDDTPAYEDYYVYGPKTQLPIMRPTEKQLKKINTVIVTAYLHDRDIQERLRSLGYKGLIYSVRPDSQAETTNGPDSFFA